MPTLDAFINRGVMGNLATLQPILSPMLWNSVATGKLATNTRIARVHRAGSDQRRGASLHEHFARKATLEHSDPSRSAQ